MRNPCLAAGRPAGPKRQGAWRERGRYGALRHLHIHAGRSSQSTLLGRDCETLESLYLSPALVERLNANHKRVANG